MDEAALYLLQSDRIVRRALTAAAYWTATRGEGSRSNPRWAVMEALIDAGSSFGMRNFGNLDLGDQRRTKRLVALADGMCRHPGGTLPDKFSKPAELKAFYRLMKCKNVTHAALMQGHTDQTRRCIAELPASQAAQPPALPPALPSGKPTTVLILHDATELDYTTITSLKDQLGQIGQGTHRGYICQNSLAVHLAADKEGGALPETLGLLSQILHHRPRVSKNETKAQKRKRLSRESRLWVRGVEACGPSPENCLCVDVSDALSDTFEYMSHEVRNGRHFVLRSRENRRLMQLGNAASDAAATDTCSDDTKYYLYETLRALEPAGTRPLTIQASPGRTARKTTVHVSFCPVRLALPGKKLGEYGNEALDLWAVRVWEPNTPKDEEPLEWILLTNCPVRTLADAFERVDWYSLRWIVEEYHKGMKTGCGIETLQLTSITRVEPAIALISAVATTLLRLRDAARAPDADTRAATDIIDRVYVDALAAVYPGRLKGTPSVLTFYMHVARLGGHQNRKGDGFPGWLTLWRGWSKLESIVTGYTAGSRICG